MPPTPDVPNTPEIIAEPRSPLLTSRELTSSPNHLQYFSRLNFHHPPENVPILTETPDPDEAVADGVAEQWIKLLAGQPIDANTTFSAAPHSTYHGYEVLPDGQIVDHFTAWNVFRVHRNPETDLPYTSTGHESIRKLRAPADPARAWPLEAPYPTNERIREEMVKMTPLEPPPPGQPGFPVHATFIPPPLEGLTHVINAYKVRPVFADKECCINNIQDKKAAAATQDPSQAVQIPKEVAIRPSDTLLPKTPPGHERAFKIPPPINTKVGYLETIYEDDGLTEMIQNLDKDIEERAAKGLAMPDDGSPVERLMSSDDDEPPELVPIFPNSGDSDPSELASASPGSDDSGAYCVACLREPHDSVYDCPMWERATTEPESDTSSESEHTFLVDRQMIMDALADAERSEELKRVLDVALAPPLNELLSMKGPRAVAYIRLADTAIEARRALARLLQEDKENDEAEARSVARELIRESEPPPESVPSSELASSEISETLASESDSFSLASPLDERSSLAPVDPGARPWEERSVPATESPLTGSSASPPLISPPESPPPLVLSPDSPFLPASISHADQVVAPRLNEHHGQPFTRLSWSSSPEPIPADDTSDEEVPLLTFRLGTGTPSFAVGEHLETSSFTNASPAVTEWSVWSEDFNINPQLVLNDAISRTAAQVPERVITDHGQPIAQISEEYLEAPAEAVASIIEPVANSAPTHNYRRPTGTFADQQLSLRIWHRNGTSHQDQHDFYEDEVIGRPLRDALAVLYGPLREFLDFPAMAAEGVRNLAQLSTVSLDIPLPAYSADRESPAPTYPADGSMPVFISAYSQPDLWHATPLAESDLPTPSPESASDEFGGNIGQAAQENGRKRKMPDGERRGEFQSGARKKLRKFQGDALRHMVIKNEAFQATGLADPEVIKQFAGARLAILEGLSWIEGIIWHRYDVPEVRALYTHAAQSCAHDRSNVAYQQRFPSVYVQHPLLFDFEAAKAHTVWAVLRERKRFTLAGYLQDFLTIRLRDEYAVSQMLNAGSLHDAYPADDTRYWNLIPAEDFVGSDYESDCASSYDPSDSSDTDFGELTYPDDYLDQERLQSPAELHKAHDAPSPTFLEMDRDKSDGDGKRGDNSSIISSTAHDSRVSSWVDANCQAPPTEF
ncbi:hypothetical protein C8R44DRAFT_863791 [Mycena epipterygia]|nr:hypothetical protein C8R44DRAFT_863791 [Mycena epipterygia]